MGKLKERYPNAKIFGIDFAFGMIEMAHKNTSDVCVLQSDAIALPFKPGSFDMIFSNLTYQWIEDLQNAFEEESKALKENGVFYFTCFGKNTLSELFCSLNASSDNTFSNSILSEKKTVETALKHSGFNNVEVDAKTFTMDFPDIFELVRWLKNTGANGLKHNIFVGRDLLMKADGFYKKNFSNGDNVYASFELIFGKAEK